MKYAAGVIALLTFLLFANAKVHAAECTDLAPFIQANTLFTQAEKTDPKTARDLWQQGQDLLRKHSDDVPSCSEQDQFDLYQLRALEHGLALESSWSDTDAIKTRRLADNMWSNTMDSILTRSTHFGEVENVQRYLQKRWGELYDEAAHYHEAVVSKGRAEIFALHSTTAPGCAHPYLDAAPVDIVTPNFPFTGYLTGEATVRIEVTLDESGKITGSRFLQRTGNKPVDAAAFDAAMKTTYAPKVVNCKAVTGTYTFQATFDPN